MANPPKSTSVVTIESVQALVIEKESLEGEIVALTQTLTGPGGLGRRGGLVDAEGFPLQDVGKLVATATARNQLAMKENDLKDLMRRIERDLMALHAEAKEKKAIEKAQTVSPLPPPSALPAPTSAVPLAPPPVAPPILIEDLSHLLPFAIVNSIAPQSPAAESGLQEKDLILNFATVDVSNNDGLKAIPAVVKEGVPVQLVVRRGVDVKRLTLIPRQWGGRGLLGCHLLPFKGQN